LALDSVACVAPKRVSDRVDDTERVYGNFSTTFIIAGGYWAPASLGKDVSGGKTKVERDAKEVTNSVLANQARMARLDEKIRKVRVSELFMEIESYRTGLMKASTFKVRVHHCKNVAHNVRRWCS